MSVIKATPRPRCSVEGCNNLAQMAGRRPGGKIRYRNVCTTHHRLKYSMANGNKRKLSGYSHFPCEICGWKESYTDRHRIDPTRGYTDDNIIILCPNCHRVETFGKLTAR